MSMTVTEVITAARDLYNSTGDSFFSDTQMYVWIKKACDEMAKKAKIIERTYTTTTVDGQQDYAYPTNTIEIKRVTYNGAKLKRITHRDDDTVTLANAASTQTGSSIYYTDWNFTLSLRPIPDSAVTLKIYSYNLAQAITATSTIEIPDLFQFDITYYLNMMMATKDQNWDAVTYFKGMWDQAVMNAIAWKKRQKRSDSFATVQDEESHVVTNLGEA